MALSNDITSYEDVREYCDRALTSPKGIRVTPPTPGGAVHLRQRIYKLRQLERANAVAIYEIGHPLRGRSAYDNIIVNIVDGAVEITVGEPIQVEEL